MALNFAINFGGNGVDVLGQLADKTAKTEGNLGKAKKGVEAFEAELGKLSGSVGGLGVNLDALSKGGAVFTFDLAEGARVAFEAVSKVVEKVIDLGKELVKEAAESQDLDFAITASGGPEALATLEKVVEARRQVGSRLSKDESKERLLPFLDLDIKDATTLSNLLDLQADAVARLGKERGGEVLGGVEKFIQRGELNPKILAALHIKRADFYKDLGEALGTSAAVAEQRATKGLVAQKDLLNFIFGEFDKKGGLGKAGEESAKTLGGTLDRLSAARADFFDQLASSPGIGKVATVAEDLIKVFGDPKNVEAMSHVVDDLADGLGAVWEAAKAVGSAVKDVLSALGLLEQHSTAYNKGTVTGRDEKGGVTVMEESDRAELLDRAGKGGLLHSMFASDEELTNEALEQLAQERRQGALDSALADIDAMGTAHDFVYRGGRVQKIDSADDLVGFKAGGPVLAAVGGPSGSMGAGSSVAVTWTGDVIVNGSGGGDDVRAALRQDVRAEFQRIIDEVGATYGAAA
jgi:hypothetical protein